MKVIIHDLDRQYDEIIRSRCDRAVASESAAV